eukprot:TRINITY_DN3887_c0_g1_i6.p1 TRINITY_DN3887_c0_g1~~TRINITY_DN3887_c0_g1_i6.p1  ORF type:complete len:1300 (-),score=259.34 TRINITY_DN3887_c0_g1_i6:170-4069(-)
MSRIGHVHELSLDLPTSDKGVSHYLYPPVNRSKSAHTNANGVEPKKHRNIKKSQTVENQSQIVAPSSQQQPARNHASMEQLYGKVRTSILRIQKLAIGSGALLEDFFNFRAKEADVSSRLEQLASVNRRAAIAELLNICRILYSAIISKQFVSEETIEIDQRTSMGRHPYPSPSDQLSMSPEYDTTPVKYQTFLPPLNRTSSTTPDMQRKSEEARQDANLTANHRDHVHEVSVSASHRPQTQESSQILDAHDDLPLPAPVIHNSNSEDKKSEAPHHESNESGRRQSVSGRESRLKLLNAVAKFRALKSVFNQTSFYTNPDVAKKIFALLSNKRSAALSRFLSEWKSLEEGSKEEWMKEISNQFIRIGTTLSVYSEATACPTNVEALKTITHSMHSTLRSRLVQIYRVSEGGQSYSLISSTVDSSHLNIFYPTSRGLVGKVITNGSSVQFSQFESSDVLDTELDQQLLEQAVCCNPLEDHDGNTIGALLVTSQQLSREDIRLMDSLASFTGLLVYNSILSERENKMRNRFNALVEIANVVSSELRIQPLIDILKRKSRELLDADKCTLYIVDHEKQELWTTLEEGDELRIPISQGIAGSVATTGNVINIPDAYEDPRFNRKVDTLTGYRTKTILCMPVTRKDSGLIIAVIQMINKAHGVFNPDDEMILEAFCTQAAISISNSQTFGRELHEREKFQALVDISKVISSELELDPLVDVLRSKSREIVQADRCTLFFADPVKKVLTTKLLEGNVISVPFGSGIAGYVAQEGLTLNIKDAYAEPRFNQDVDKGTGYKTDTILCTPVKLGDGKVIGALQMVNKLNGNPFNEDDEDILSAFCTQAAIAIENSHLYQRMTEMNQYMHGILQAIKHYVLHISNEGILQTVNHSLKDIFGAEDSYFKNNRVQDWFGNKNSRLVNDVESVLNAEDDHIFVHNFNLVPKAMVRFKSYAKIAPKALGDQSPQKGSNGSFSQRLSVPVNYIVTKLNDGKGSTKGVLLIIEDLTEMESMKREVDALQVKIGDMTTQTTQLIEAPIQMVLRTVQNIAKGVIDPETAQKQLLECVSLIAQVDLFKPRLEEILGNSLDENTRKWILNEVSVPESNSAVMARSWPDLSTLIRQKEMSEQTAAVLFDWELDGTQFSDSELMAMIMQMFNHLGLLVQFNVKVESFKAFLETIRRNYHANPFHNFQHCFTVAHISFLVLVHTSAAQYLSNLDIYALMLSALCHDLDHPGLTNGYEISSESVRAMLYNDISVLENHHAHMAFRLLLAQDAGIIRHLPKVCKIVPHNCNTANFFYPCLLQIK